MENLLLLFLFSLKLTYAHRHHWPSPQTKIIHSNSGNESYCLLWTRPNTDREGCYCGNDLHGVVHCDHRSLDISLLPCFCMSYSKSLNKTVVGYCIFTCIHIGHYMKVEAKDNVLDLNNNICNSHKNFSRTSLMCGECKEGHAPPVYSFSLACVECSNYKYNWLKYIAIAFLPVTFFYIIVILFRVTVMSPAVISYVLVSQVIAIPTQIHFVGITHQKNLLNDISTKIFFVVYGMWNLDSLRGVFEPFCLHPKFSLLDTLLLDYTLAVYPIFLILITYLFVNFHDNSRAVRWMWRPFLKCFVHIRREWNIRSSLISAFATFILMSYVKILDVTFQILTPTKLYDVNGNQLPQLYLYYNGTVEYFGKEHLPYAVLAIIMFTVFNVFPLLLLCLYPCQCLQRCLNCCNIRWLSLHIFMDTLHGCFKLKPYDCRYFAAFYLSLRITNYVIVLLTTSVLYYPIIAVCSAIAATVTALARPYRKHLFHTIIDVVMLLSLALMAASLTISSFAKAMDPNHVLYDAILLPLLISTPPLYGLLLLMYKVVPKRVLMKFKDLLFNTLYHRFGLNRLSRGDDSEIPVIECITERESEDSSAPLIPVPIIEL